MNIYSNPIQSNQDLNSFLYSELVIAVDDIGIHVNRGTNWILGFKNESKIIEGKFSLLSMSDFILPSQSFHEIALKIFI